MKETHLTQEGIDHGSERGDKAKQGIYSKASDHPFLAGGAILVGAGLAYAAAKVIGKSVEDKGVVTVGT